jgi:hypothetical protein
MSVNREKPHVYVLPEDRPNSQMANGFVLELDPSVLTRIQVLREAGGWTKVLHRFNSDHASEMDVYPNEFIDFDGKQDRLERARAEIPSHLTDRVSILGAWTEPEALKKARLGSFESIGKAQRRRDYPSAPARSPDPVPSSLRAPQIVPFFPSKEFWSRSITCAIVTITQTKYVVRQQRGTPLEQQQCQIL